MKIRTLLGACVLSFVLSGSALAGDMQGPGYVPPPPVCIENCQQSSGDIQAPGVASTETSAVALAEVALAYMQSVISLF